jgi:hypothetical protein
VMPELGLTLGYDFTARLRGTIGYSFIYWSKVQRAGEQVDLLLNPNLFPPQKTTGNLVGQPAYHGVNNDYWTQGLNFGFQYSF